MVQTYDPWGFGSGQSKHTTQIMRAAGGIKTHDSDCFFQTYFFGVNFFSYTFYIFCIDKEHFLYTHLTIFKYMINTF